MTVAIDASTTEPTVYRIIEVKSNAVYLTCEGIEEPSAHVVLVYGRPVNPIRAFTHKIQKTDRTCSMFQEGQMFPNHMLLPSFDVHTTKVAVHTGPATTDFAMVNIAGKNGPTIIQFQDGSTYLGVVATWIGAEKVSTLHTHTFTLVDKEHEFFVCDNLGRP